VSDSVLVDPQNPPRTATPKPIWRPLNRARRDQIVALTVFHVFFKSRYLHSINERHNVSVLVNRRVLV
jgi:hypothetical protein